MLAGVPLVSAARALLQLQDLDLLLEELESPAARGRLAKLGLAPGEPAPFRRVRARLHAGVDARWQRHYDRAQLRYGRGVVGVRGRVCLGCRITLPTSAAPGPGEFLTLCESCGRILYWG